MTRTVLAAALLAACSRQPRDAATPTPARPSPSPVIVADAGRPIAWQWDAKAPRWYKAPLVVGPSWGDDFVFTRLDDDHADVRRVAPVIPVEHTVWKHALPPEFVPDAALLVTPERVYVAYHSDIDSGGQLIALDAADGHELWASKLEALGPVAHSEYENSIQLAELGGQVVVFGWESSGRYIESFDAAGSRLSHQRLADPLH